MIDKRLSVRSHTEVMRNFYKTDEDKYTRNVTLQVTEGCQLRCTYCYQTHKNDDNHMSWETAKSIIDRLFKMREDDTDIIGQDTEVIVLDFIGGEPLIMAELIEKVIEYFWLKAIETNSPWVTTFRASMSTNGVAYFEPASQRLLKRFGDRISLGITVDGDKEMHDACRIFPDGRGSYDLAWAASEHYRQNYNPLLTTKITYCPENIPQLYRSFRHFADAGYDAIYGNVAFEPLYTPEDALIFYTELKKVADYILDNDRDVYFAPFDAEKFVPLDDDHNTNWCGGTGAMLSFDPDGNAFPCQRYTKISLGDSQPPIIIGNALEGVLIDDKYARIQKDLESITRRSQSTDECYYCPIARGCAWCSAYNYQLYGTVNKRSVNHCITHKARALVNAYYWFKHELKYNDITQFKLHIPEEWALEIISKDEWDMIKDLELQVKKSRQL